ncbi:hypothetical protein [Janibacter terrae]|uniref:hypothetical protein n=1 Tax=Janibacter terrae TaxID=103817 RepID=UPI0031F8D5B7
MARFERKTRPPRFVVKPNGAVFESRGWPGMRAAEVQAIADEAAASRVAAESAEASSAQSAADAQTALQAQFMTQDEGVAALINTGAGPLTDAALDATTARGTTRAGAGSYTQGDVITLGQFAHVTRADTGTNLVLGGGSGGQENVIGGNLANVDTATSNLTGAPTLTDTNGNWNFLLGGYDTVVNGWANIVHGYHAKVGVDANHNTMSGGSRHDFAAGSSYGSIGGGTQNKVAGTNATIAGGNSNQATGNQATVGGGSGNEATGNGALVSGGVSNKATNSQATVAGGSSNTASGNSATVVGGLTNAATATGATSIGGRDNTASGAYSVTTGYGAVATEHGQGVHAAQPFATPGDAQTSRWVLKRQTTDATAGSLDTTPGTPPTIPENTTWAFTALVVARRADVDGENAAWEVRGCFKRDAGNTAAYVGTPTVTQLGASAGATAWTLTAASFSAGTFRLLATGEAGKTIRWVADVRAAHVSG